MTDTPDVPTPPLSKNQRVALAVVQLLMGIFIIFMAGTILHHYMPVPGVYGVYFEGFVLGVVVVLHVNKVILVYKMTEEGDA